MSLWCQLYGHKKEYVGVENGLRAERVSGNAFHIMAGTGETVEVEGSKPRWACKRCPAMGVDGFREGAFKVKFGKLVQDKKLWANPDGKPSEDQDDDKKLHKALLQRLDSCFCDDIGQYQECERCKAIRSLMQVLDAEGSGKV